LINKGTQRFTEFQGEVIARWKNGEVEQKAAQLEIEHFWAGALRRAVVDGDVENGSVMAGQSVGMVTKEQTTLEILQELVAQAEAGLSARPPRKIA
jgi:enoyl-[acyl-carrier protein] reductase II